MKKAKITGPLFLTEVLPALASELKTLLVEEGYEELARQVDHLQIQSRCQCGDEFCAAFFTAYGHAYSINLHPTKGIIIIDVNNQGKISEVEVLFRPEYKQILDQVMPLPEEK